MNEKDKPMSLDDAIMLLCGVHLRAMEFDDWRVEVGATPSTPWDAQDYPRAWAALREYALSSRSR